MNSTMFGDRSAMEYLGLILEKDKSSTYEVTGFLAWFANHYEQARGRVPWAELARRSANPQHLWARLEVHPLVAICARDLRDDVLILELVDPR